MAVSAAAWSVTAPILGDAATTTQAVGGANVNIASGGTGRATSLDVAGIATSTTQGNFVWSDNASTTANTTVDADWFNGYYVSGLSSSGF